MRITSFIYLQIKVLRRNFIAKSLELILPKGFYFSQKGYCPCCDRSVVFVSYNNWLRDYFICTNCKSIPRERALMLMIEKHYPNWKNLKIHETSPVNRGASLKLKRTCDFYSTSQYYPNEIQGIEINGFRNENLENLTFPEQSFDIIVSQDVMEHIYNPDKAFREIARTLRPGGAHIFSVPLVNKHKPSEIWASLGKNGEPIFTHKPEYHGNPIDPKGSPVTMHWGYDIVDYIKKTSHLETTIEYIDNLNYGVRAEFIEILLSKKSII
jgi:SAM-dependent methyltransferase